MEKGNLEDTHYQEYDQNNNLGEYVTETTPCQEGNLEDTYYHEYDETESKGMHR